ncbi:MAG: hypothetical protein KIT17_03580 [Rubrivivax sp.]|nr:hypothetical protein [Rubrivivax sp.]
MKPKACFLAMLAVAGAAAAADAWAQDPPPPAGRWQSPASATYTNPALTGAELYLSIDVAPDGSFRGTWGRYFCTAFPGAYGIAIYSCSRTGGNRVSGRFGPGRQGAIDLDTLGRSPFTWAAPSGDELAIDLPRTWQGGGDAVLYRARMTRNGKPRPAASAAAPGEAGPLLSAVALYREFKQDERSALARHQGKTLVLEGRRGSLIALSDGGAAVHVPDGFQSRALVLYFRDFKQVSGIAEGAQFRFRCRVLDFAYQYVQLEDCSIVR